MEIATEPIGSIPRPLALIEPLRAEASGGAENPELESLYDEAIRDTIARFEATGADRFVEYARRHASMPLKQAVISPSGLSLLYPERGIPGYPRAAFIEDLLREHVTEVRRCLDKGARYIPVAQLGTTDDCGFSPFCDDVATTRDTAFAKIQARVLGTAMAAAVLEARS